MDWRFDGVPLSTTTTAPVPKAAPSIQSFSAPAAGIRATLSLLDESDFEHASSYYSSDGSVSGEGEEEYEDPVEEIVEETHFVKEYAFSRPKEKNPHGDVVQESSTSGSGNGVGAFSRPSGDVVQESSGGITKNEVIGDGSSSSSVSSIVSENAFSRPYIRSLVSSDLSEFTDSDEDDSDVVEDDSDVEYGSSSSRPLVDEESEVVAEKEPSSVVSAGVSSLPVSLRPVALISGDSEDDDDNESRGSEAMEDDGISGAVARVPSTEGLTGIVDSPKVRDGDDMVGDGLEGVSAAERMIFEDLGELDNGMLGQEGETVGVMELEVAELESSSSCQEMEKEKLEIHGTDQEESFADSASDFPEILEFSDCLVETKQVGNVLDRHEEAGVSNVYQSVSLDMALDDEINIEAEDDEHLFVEVENGMLPSKSVAAEVEMEEMSLSQSGGGNLHDSLGEIVDKSVSDLQGKVEGDDGINHGRDINDSSVTQLSPLEVDFSLPLNEARSPVLLAPATPNVESEQPRGEREHRKRLEQMPHLLFLHRLGSGLEGSLDSDVAEGKQPTSAKASAVHLEVQSRGDVDSSLNILIIGKTGVGKSATINSIFGEMKMLTDAFKPATPRVKEVCGMIDGVKVKVLDTPGLRTNLRDQSFNRKILLSIKKQMKKSPPDVVLYMDRLDMQTSEMIDLPLIRSISTYLGSAIWHKSVIVLTHAKSLPPDGPDGAQLNLDLYVAQRLRVLRQMISRSAVDQTNIGAMVPVSLVENHPVYKKNDSGESWELPLLFLCHSMKILSELDSAPATGGCLIRFMRWSCDLICRCNLQSAFRVDADTKQRIWAELNKKLSSELPLDTSNQLQLGSLVLVAIANVIVFRMFG